MVQAAGEARSAESRQALAELCEKYWYPLYVYIRRRITDPNEAQDLTQAFFAQLLEKNYVEQADPARGRFRTFLIAAVNHFLANEWKKGQAQRRGGQHKILSIDVEAGEASFTTLPQTTLTPDRIYDREWALCLLRRVLGELRAEAAAADKLPQFEHLEHSLTREDSRMSYAELGTRIGLTESAAKVAVHRMRERYRYLLRTEIAQTMADPGAVDDEIRRLFATFAN